MPKKFNTKEILKSIKSLKKKLNKQKSRKSVDNLTAEEGNYLPNDYNNQELVVDYREPVWDGKEYLPTESTEDYDDSGEEETEASDDDHRDDNDPSNQHNEPALPMEESQGVPGHYRIRKRQLEVDKDDEQAVAKFITSSSKKRLKVRKIKNNKVSNQSLSSDINYVHQINKISDLSSQRTSYRKLVN